MYKRKNVTSLTFIKASDVDNETYSVEALDEKDEILFIIEGDEKTKQISILLGSIEPGLSIEYTYFFEKVKEAHGIVQAFLDEVDSLNEWLDDP